MGSEQVRLGWTGDHRQPEIKKAGVFPIVRVHTLYIFRLTQTVWSYRTTCGTLSQTLLSYRKTAAPMLLCQKNVSRPPHSVGRPPGVLEAPGPFPPPPYHEDVPLVAESGVLPPPLPGRLATNLTSPIYTTEGREEGRERELTTQEKEVYRSKNAGAPNQIRHRERARARTDTEQTCMCTRGDSTEMKKGPNKTKRKKKVCGNTALPTTVCCIEKYVRVTCKQRRSGPGQISARRACLFGGNPPAVNVSPVTPAQQASPPIVSSATECGPSTLLSSRPARALSHVPWEESRNY